VGEDFRSIKRREKTTTPRKIKTSEGDRKAKYKKGNYGFEDQERS